jgi:hypothetical protein
MKSKYGRKEKTPEILDQITGDKARRVFNQALEKYMRRD